jgi:hypothetical protein
VSTLANSLQPFLYGTRPTWRKVAQIAYTAGLAIPATKFPKYGYLAKVRYRFVLSVNVTTAGSAGTPKLQFLFANYNISLNGNYQYRNMDGESLALKNSLQQGYANEPTTSSLNYTNYNPASATAQTVQYTVSDDIALNDGVNADKFLLAAQARNYDIILGGTFGANPSGTAPGPTGGIAANTEVAAITGTLYVEGLYFLDPDYTKFAPPDGTQVQQILDDLTYTNVSVGDNVIPIVPINGPQYLQLCFKPVFNGVIDTQGVNSKVTNVRFRVNNAQDLYDVSAQTLYQENYDHYGRTPPFGYYVLDFLDDISLVNAVSAAGTRVLSTATLASLELIVTVASGTTVTNSLIKLWKRLKNPAIT